ncbi:zinc finger protein with KRAB and SCAN domains 7-like isoform X5 [Ahaetulla prasina]|uniref:zinc finger protein with KRAB and SCAN domains 7-like isoform X5 n=1 Tax=Ahaetulla prasina TaxID=499056 RepID=UPI0026486322|nr:zinc finger protein with KRAB and SCAN domains 7-like isoform X5 [Ahaetulla prasina]
MEKGLEGSGKVPRIVQVMYFKGVPKQPNQQPEPGLPQQWEAQWQEFLNTLQPSHTGWGNPQLTDMAPWDDPRAFLMAFEQVAEACQWPREEWVRQLLPALRTGMEQSFCRLDGRDRSDYTKVKAAILRAEALRMEMKRQHFRQCSYQELEGPRRVYSQLQDLCRQWLKPESHTKEQILEMIIQEQLLGMLPAEAQNWVRECGPKDCVEMVALAEEFLMSHRHAPRTCDWQVPLPEVSVSSLEAEGRPRQQYNPGASEMTPTRNSVLAHPSSAGLEMAETGTTEEPVRIKEELSLDQKPIHWEVMRGSAGSSSTLGLLVPTPEVNSQTDQSQATFQERPEHGDQNPDALFGASESNQGQSNSTQAQKSPLELLGELSTVSLIAVSDANPVSRLRPRKSRGVERSQIYGLKSLKVMLKKLPSPQKGKSKGPDDCDRRATELFKTIKRRTVRAGERSYDCSDCGKAFSRPSHLYQHEKGTACRKERPISDSIFAEEIPCGGEEESRSTCPLQQNIKLEDEGDDQQSPTVYQEEGQTANEPSEHQNTKMHACTKCGYQAEKLSDILKHFRVHNKEKPYRYLDCGNSFGWSSTLTKHQQPHVASPQMPVPNVVAECDVTLSDDEELINFLAKKPPRQEAGLQNCPKRSSKRSPAAVPPSSAPSKLKASLPFRSRERNGKGKPIPCQNNVKKTRHDGLEKKHVCLDCGHRTYYLSDLVRHKNSHPNGKPYKCPECEKIFAQPSFLKIHLKAHKPGGKPMKRLKAPQGERKYTCSKCGHKTYKLSTHLLHMRAHVGESEKSYLCDECGKEFKRSSNLSRHKRIHNRNNEGFKIRRPSFTQDKEINRSYEEPKKTAQAHLKKISGRSPASTASNIAALRKHWRNYKRQQRKKAAEKRQKMEASPKKMEESPKKMEESPKKMEESPKKMEENIKEKETEEKFPPELSLRARLERFAYSKNRVKADSQEERAPDPKVSSSEELHQKCTVCGKNFTYDGQLTDHQNLDTEAKPHRCNECRK